MQLWALLADFDDDVEPGSHACRLRLSLATRTCPELQTPWQVSEHLLMYLTKLDFIPPACQLPAVDELLLLRAHATAHPSIAQRAAYLEAALAPNGAAPPAGLVARVGTICGADPLIDPPLAYESLTSAQGAATWQRRVMSCHYNRPDEARGPTSPIPALAVLSYGCCCDHLPRLANVARAAPMRSPCALAHSTLHDLSGRCCGGAAGEWASGHQDASRSYRR